MSTSGLDLTILLVSIIAPVGAFDVLYYHIYKFRLATRPASWAETRTHIVRSLSLGVLVLVIALWEPRGAWFWIIAGVFGVDVINSAADAWLERDSRADLGGLPRLEYLVHILGSTFMGAVALSFVIRGWSLGALDTALVARPHPLPLPMEINAIAIGLGSLALAGYETIAMAMSMRRQGATA